MSVISKHFFRGVLILIPILATIYVAKIVLDTLSPLLGWLGGFVPVPVPDPVRLLFGVVLSIALITLVGVLASNWFGRWVVSGVDRFFQQVPLVKLLHGSIKDLLGAFVGEKKSFDAPVAVALTADGAAKVVGFVTRDDLSFLGLAGDVAVYLPQSYNFAGNLILVPRERVQPLSTSSSDVMAFLVSGGVSAKEG
ncbi:MAG: DUF502 domain-containing protein [Planctomycetota bacterium]